MSETENVLYQALFKLQCSYVSLSVKNLTYFRSVSGNEML